jgi:hypothetical protein
MPADHIFTQNSNIPTPSYHAIPGYCFLALLLFFSLSDATSFAQSSNDEIVNPLYVNPASYDFSQNPPLLERIKSGPHGYFRFINLQFSQEVCRRFQKYFQGATPLNLHGDAHLEQYAITDIGRGLTDFDDSSKGPAVLDILRFGVSLRLACRQLGWNEQANNLFDTFLFGYRMALNDPKAQAKEPVIVQKIRSGFKYDRNAYLKWVEAQMIPISPSAKDSLYKAMQQYIDAMLADNPGHERSYFNLVQAGYLKMGIGSALDLKYLARIRGKSDDPLDDVVLEIKEVRDISGIDCILRTEKSDPFRVLLGQARIAYEPFKHLGYFHFKGLTFWVHSWVENYKEVSIGKSFETVEQLSEVVYDVGIQLGHGHTRLVASPFDTQLKRSHLRNIGIVEKQIKQACIDLADLTVKAWESFCANIESK